MNTLKWISTLFPGRSFVCGIVNGIFKKNVSKVESDIAINEVLLYGTENEEENKQIGFDNLLCIYYVILHATRTVDLCVPSLASDTLAKCLISAQQKNKVKIRITIHNSGNFNNLQVLAQHGVEVKIINPTVRLEHEFLLIDALDEYKDAVAVMGSLDYEPSRVNCNRDATVLTSEIAVVSALKREFDRVWNSVPDIAKFDIVK